MVPIYKHNDTAYIILSRDSIERFFNKEKNDTVDLNHVKAYRDWIGADHVLRDNTDFLFCETIQDVEWEEITNEDD